MYKMGAFVHEAASEITELKFVSWSCSCIDRDGLGNTPVWDLTPGNVLHLYGTTWKWVSLCFSLLVKCPRRLESKA